MTPLRILSAAYEEASFDPSSALAATTSTCSTTCGPHDHPCVAERAVHFGIVPGADRYEVLTEAVQ